MAFKFPMNDNQKKKTPAKCVIGSVLQMKILKSKGIRTNNLPYHTANGFHIKDSNY